MNTELIFIVATLLMGALAIIFKIQHIKANNSLTVANAQCSTKDKLIGDTKIALDKMTSDRDNLKKANEGNEAEFRTLRRKNSDQANEVVEFKDKMEQAQADASELRELNKTQGARITELTGHLRNAHLRTETGLLKKGMQPDGVTPW